MPDEKELLAALVMSETPGELTPFAVLRRRSRARARRRTLGGTAVAGLTLASAVTIVSQQHLGPSPTAHTAMVTSPATTTPGSGTTTPSSPGTAQPSRSQGGPLTSCAEQYDVKTLRTRSFAFDGTVLSVSPADMATFRVHTWFAGGRGPRVTIRMPGRPATGNDIQLDELGPRYGVGSRLLVSGEPRWGGQPLDHAIAWPCCFTQQYSPAGAALWRKAFPLR